MGPPHWLHGEGRAGGLGMWEGHPSPSCLLPRHLAPTPPKPGGKGAGLTLESRAPAEKFPRGRASPRCQPRAPRLGLEQSSAYPRKERGWSQPLPLPALLRPGLWPWLTWCRGPTVSVAASSAPWLCNQAMRRASTAPCWGPRGCAAKAVRTEGFRPGSASPRTLRLSLPRVSRLRPCAPETWGSEGDPAPAQMWAAGGETKACSTLPCLPPPAPSPLPLAAPESSPSPSLASPAIAHLGARIPAEPWHPAPRPGAPSAAASATLAPSPATPPAACHARRGGKAESLGIEGHAGGVGEGGGDCY